MKRPHLPWLAPGLLVLSNVPPIGRMMDQDTPSLEPRAAVASEGRPEATDSKAAEAQPEDPPAPGPTRQQGIGQAPGRGAAPRGLPLADPG
jgi:hypothetical protein